MGTSVLLRPFISSSEVCNTAYAVWRTHEQNSIFTKGPMIPITKTRLFNYIENFTTKKNENFQIKNSDIFHISTQNIDCGYSLEPPRRGGSNEYSQFMFLSRNKDNNV